MTKYYDILINTPLFASINAKEAYAMLPCLHGTVKNYKKGEYVKTTDDYANFIGIVLDGNIQIIHDDYSGNRTITASFTKGELFAEAVAFSSVTTLPSDILAVKDCTILFMDPQKILRPCSKSCVFHTQLLENLLGIVARKNMMLNQKLQYLSKKTTREKLLAYLHDQAALHQSSSFYIPFDRQALADYLCVERSAMSAELSKMQKEGLLTTKKNHFELRTIIPENK